MSIDQRPSQAPTTSTLPLRRAYLVLAVAVIADIMDLIDSSIAKQFERVMGQLLKVKA